MQGVESPFRPHAPPPGTRIYAIGDIHGRMDLLQRLLDRIAADAGHARPERVALVFLGDYLDRGPASRQVVERLMAGPPGHGPLAGADWVCLKGNHEEVMLRFLTEAEVGPGWCRYGGLETVRSYAGPLPQGAEADMPALQALLTQALPRSHGQFLARLPVIHREGDYVFAHAGLRPGVALADQDPADLLWIRDDFLYHDRPMEVTVVHGHTPTPTPEIRAHRIGVDTKAYASGNLTAVVLEGTDRRFLVS